MGVIVVFNGKVKVFPCQASRTTESTRLLAGFNTVVLFAVRYNLKVSEWVEVMQYSEL